MSTQKKPDKQAGKARMGTKTAPKASNPAKFELKGGLKAAAAPVQPNADAESGTLADAALAGNPAAMAFSPDVSTAAVALPGFDISGAVTLTRKIQAISRWRDFYDPLVSFSAARARALSEDYTRGWFADLQWTYFYLEWTDPDLFALVDRRTSRLLEMDYSIKLAKKATDDDKDAKGQPDPHAAADAVRSSPLRNLANEQEEFLRERFEKVDNLYDAIEHLALASFRGYAHLEKWYGDDGELNHLEVVDQWNVVRDGLRGGWKYNPRAWQTGFFGLDKSLIIDPSNFIVREVRRHINRIALLKFTAKRLAEVDWDAFVEIYGIPSGVVIGPSNIPQERAEEFRAVSEDMSKGASVFLPNGSLYEKNDMPRGNSPFKERLEYLTEKLILVGTGGLLTMLARSGSGTLAGNAHADVFEQLAKAEARKISEVFNRQLVKPWLDLAFPGQPQLAYFDLSSQEETKLGEIVAHIQALAGAGYQVDPDEVSERTGYTVTLKPQATGAGASGQEKSLTVDGKNSDPNTGDPANVENRRKILNRAGYDTGAAVFERNALRKLSTAQTEAMGPLLDRIAAMKNVPAADLGDAIEKLRTDLPRMFAEARLHAPDIADVWEQVLGTALVDGLADLPSKK